MIAEALTSFFRAKRPDPGDDFWYRPVAGKTPSGIAVKPDNAMKVGAVFACIRVLRESLASLPFRVYKRTGPRTSEKAPDYYAWQTLHNRPNSWQTPMEWKDMGVAHLCLRGNFYSRIVDTAQGRELWPLSPDHVTVEQRPDGAMQYTYRARPGTVEKLSSLEVLHVRGLTLNGINGVSILEYAQNTVGLSIAQQNHGSTLFVNGGLPAFWISRPVGAPWTNETKKNFREGWRKIHGGSENAGNPPLLQDGMEIHELGLSNRDSQWLESLDFNATDIARFFGVPPHMIGIRNAEPRANVEQASLEFVIYTLGPLAVRFEQAANRDLIDDDTYYTKIALDALMRGDMLSRYQAHNIAIQGGWELVNEARELEDRNPIEGGDVPRYPANLQPAGGGPDQNEQGGQPGKGKPKQPAQKQDEEPTRRERQRQSQAAFERMLDDAAERVAAAEIRGLSARADKAAKDRKRWMTWATDFYVVHRAYGAKVLLPIVAAWAAATGEEKDVEPLAADLVSACGPIFDADTDIPAVLAEWERDRPAQLAKSLKARFFDAVP